MILAPFFGIRNCGVARWMNRILILLELAIPVLGCYMQYTDPFGGKWMYAVIVATCYFGACILNAVLHKLNRLAVALVYGTSDPNEIGEIIRKREEKDLRTRMACRKAAQD